MKQLYGDTLGAVLAGGRSSRMGQDKALVRFRGRPLVEHALALLARCGVDRVIAGANPESRADLEQRAPVLEDLHPGCGPLSGMEAALDYAHRQGRERLLLLPVDVPLLDPALLHLLIERSALTGALVTVPTVAGQAQPLCSVVSVGMLPTLIQAREGGDYKVMRIFRRLRAGELDEFALEAVAAVRRGWPTEPPLSQWFENLNTPGDLERVSMIETGLASAANNPLL